MPPHECTEHEHIRRIEDRIDHIDSRLGDGDVTLNTLALKLDEIHAQTKRTNGRVTSLEDDAVRAKIDAAKRHYTPLQLVRDVVAVIAFVGVAYGAIVSVSRTIAPPPKISITQGEGR